MLHEQSQRQTKDMGKPHVVAIPYPAQGHVIPLMELVQCLVKQGVKVTFVNTDFIHKQVMNALSEKDEFTDLINMVSIPDGVEPWEDRSNLGELSESIFRFMPGKLQELIEKINGNNDDKVTCVIADDCMGWAIDVAKMLGLKRVAWHTASAATLVSMFSFQKLIDDRIINESGTPIDEQMIQLSPTMPVMKNTELAWASVGDLATQKVMFDVSCKAVVAGNAADWVICNSANVLEPDAFTLFPKFLPIGPLLASNRLARQAGHFWQEDSSCLTWLDQQPACSVIYVAFGSFTVFDTTQIQELALGLELTNRPFLWVVRPGMTDKSNNTYPEGFEDRVGSRGRMVGWTPQQKILSHPSIACFLSHCGWNSTLEGLMNGIPFLCWPYFADQLLNRTYICDIWKNGLGFNKDESGIIRQGEIKNKVEQLLDTKTYKESALDLKEKVLSSVKEGGCSHKNFNNIIDWIKEKDDEQVDGCHVSI